MAGTPEAFSRVVIDAQLKDVGWSLTDGVSVRYEYALPDDSRVDYVLCDRHGRAVAVVEAKRATKSLQEAAEQGRAYARQLSDAPYVRDIASYITRNNQEGRGMLWTKKTSTRSSGTQVHIFTRHWRPRSISPFIRTPFRYCARWWSSMTVPNRCRRWS
ncbi:MAG: type I restriction endonuclease [Gammaproteobacteria bacterium]